MKKLIKSNISVMCAICLIVCIVGGFASAETSAVNTEAEASADGTSSGTPTGGNNDAAAYSTIPLYLNGIKMTDGIVVEDTTYIPLRAFFNVIGNQTNITWNDDTNTATVTGKDFELTATTGNYYFKINDRFFYLPQGALIIDGSLSLPVRELAKVFSATVEWDSETSSVNICSDNITLIATAKNFYNEQDLYWLSRLINAEAGNQPLDGKIGVGNVVLNRVADPSCPDTIYGVIFDSKYGVQFSVTTTGGIYAEPNEESVIAAKICLEGYNIVGNSIYFVNPQVGVSSWFAKTRVFVATIGQHDFYA